MVLPHQANHVIIQLVLFKHGDGEIRLLHCYVQPADRKGALRYCFPSSRPPLPGHSPLSLSVLALLLHLLGLCDVKHRHLLWSHAFHGQL